MADDHSDSNPDFSELPDLVLENIIGMLPVNDRKNLPLDNSKLRFLLNSHKLWKSLSLTLTDGVQVPEEERRVIHTCNGAMQLWRPPRRAVPPAFIPIPVFHEDSDSNAFNVSRACCRGGAHYGFIFIPVIHRGTQPRKSDSSYPSSNLSFQERRVLTLFGHHLRELTLNIDSLGLHEETKSVLQDVTSKWDPRTLTLKFSEEAVIKAGTGRHQHHQGFFDLLEVGLFSAKNLERLTVDTSEAVKLNFHESYTFTMFFEKRLLVFLGSADVDLPGLKTLELRGCNSHPESVANQELFENVVARHSLLTHLHLNAVNLCQGVLQELSRSARAPLQTLTVEFTGGQTYHHFQDLRQSWSALVTSNPFLEVTCLFATSWLDRSVMNVLTETAPVVSVEATQLPALQMLLLVLIPFLERLTKFTCTDVSLPGGRPDLESLLQFLGSCPNLDHLVYHGPVSDDVVQRLRSLPGRQWKVLDFNV